MFAEHYSSWLAGDAQPERLQAPVVLSFLHVAPDGDYEGHELGENGDQPLPAIAAAVCARHLFFDCNSYWAALSTVPPRGDESEKTNPVGWF